MTSLKRRPALLALVALSSMLVAACGASARTTHRPARRPPAVTLQGRLLRVHGNSLDVQRGAGPATVRVTFAPMVTPIYAVTDATGATMQPGSCVTVQGDRDTAGLTARVVVVAGSADDACPAGSRPPLPPSVDPGPSPSAPPPVSAAPSPSAGPAVVSGQVLSVGGGAIAVKGPDGDPAVVLVPRDAEILFFQPSGRAALIPSSCVVVRGTGSSRVVAAWGIVDWPPGTAC